MRATIEIPEDLAADAAEYARRHQTTLDGLVVEGLRAIVRKADKPLVPPTFPTGKSMPHQTTEWWDNIRDVAYEREDTCG